MATDETDPLICLRDAAHALPRKNGKTMRLETLRRWAAKGVHGRKLRTAKVGGQYFTRLSWIEEFCQNTPPAAELPQTVKPIRHRTARESAKVDRLLIAEGFFGAKAKRDLLGLRETRGRSRAVPVGLSSGTLRDRHRQDNGSSVDRSSHDDAGLSNAAHESAERVNGLALTEKAAN